MFVSDIHENFSVILKIYDFFIEQKQKGIVKYLFFLGDCINQGKNSFFVIKLLLEIKKQFPNEVFFIKGNHEGYLNQNYNNEFYFVKDFIGRLRENMILTSNDKNIFCVHGSLPILLSLQENSVKYKLLEPWENLYSIACIYNSINLVNKKSSQIKFNDKFRGLGFLIPVDVYMEVLQKNNISFCISGHSHENRIITDKRGVVRSVTICSSKKVQRGYHKVSTLFFLDKDLNHKIIDIDTLQDNKYVNRFTIFDNGFIDKIKI